MSKDKSLVIKPLNNVGVEVSGLDINQPISNELKSQLHAIWLAHGIVVFRDQPNITPESLIEFSRIFGPLEMHPLKATTSAEYPELFVLENGGETDKFNTAYYDGEAIVNRLIWHMDLHYTGKPNRGAILSAVHIAEEDGQTGFGDLAKAYTALPEHLKNKIADLEVAYTFEMQRIKWRFADNSGYEPGPFSPKKPADVGFPDFPDAVYPMVVTHPETGDKILEIVEQFLDRVMEPEKIGMSDTEADQLLHELVEHIRKPEFHYWHDWRIGDMVLWDNWRAMHCTTGTRVGIKRLINRTTIEGGHTLGRQLAVTE